MKKISLLIGILLFMNSCDKDPCDEGYTQLDSGVCVPDYIVGQLNDFSLGNVYYHNKFGVINLVDGNWYNENNLIIQDINN
jgi:hypothetical protein